MENKRSSSMSSELDISTDADFLKEIEDLQLDDVSIGTGSPLKTPPVPRKTSGNVNKSSKSRSRQKRRPSMRIQFDKKPTLDLDALLAGTDFKPESPSGEKNIADNNFTDFSKNGTNSNPKSQTIQSPQGKDDFIGNNNFDDTNNNFDTNQQGFSAALLESRVSSYLNNSLKALQEDVIFEIKNIFDNSSYTQLIDQFLFDLASDLRSEIQFVNSLSNDILYGFPIDFDVTFPRLRPYSSFPVKGYLNQIEVLKTQFSNEMTKTQNDISEAMNTRDSAVSQNNIALKSLDQKLRHLQNKSCRLELQFSDLQHVQHTLNKQMTSLNEKIEEHESKVTQNEEKMNDLDEIKSCINELLVEMEKSDKDKKNSLIKTKLGILISEQKELREFQFSTANSATKLYGNVAQMNLLNNSMNSSLNSSMNPSVNYSANQNWREAMMYMQPSVQHPQATSYSAPFSPRSPANASPVRFPLSPENPLTPPVRRKVKFSPIRVRETPNYEPDSDDGDPRMTNYLLNKQFGNSLSSYA
ncbi:hypothetical protein TRFO_36876 [Tritrichomonas foetus]|uniref:Uncharacterized protein n=1 Tax=Tritrichomonas foetus TaxID=1144522 RepID=A0A1J4JFB0_9EUKA|nr:hypothetical protein TRFO_36876 [Tritrichomonas foetus]|eukprot:OHS96983.1 hypothetical protein TRFO_36876 [Tritrichomonas foetus]